MSKHEIEILIEKADAAIVNEDFDTLMEFYDEAALLVIRPGQNVCGKQSIRKAMKKIADYFDHSLKVEQHGMKILEAGDTALVLANTAVSTNNQDEIIRKATYVFKKSEGGRWLCIIDNSYGHEIM